MKSLIVLCEVIIVLCEVIDGIVLSLGSLDVLGKPLKI